MTDVPYEYDALPIRVIDADTVEFQVDLLSRFDVPQDVGFHTNFYGPDRIENLRIVHADGSEYDAPETRLGAKTNIEEKERGLEAKKYAESILMEKGLLKIKTFYNKTGKYGRFLAAITLPDGSDYAAHMTELGHVKHKQEG